MATKMKESGLRYNFVVNAPQTVIKELQDITNKTIELSDANSKLRKEQKELDAAGKKGSEEYKKNTKAINENIGAIKANKARAAEIHKEYGIGIMTLGDLTRKQRELRVQIKNTVPNTADWHKYNEQLKSTNARITQLRAESSNTVGAMSKMGSGVTAAFGKIFIAYQAVVRVLRMFAGGIKTISDFEQANANLATILGKSRNEITALTQSAKQLGSTTEWMASQVTELQTELAKLGFNEGQIEAMQASILQFSTAIGANLADAAALTGATLRAFGLQAEDTERVVSVMTVGANRSALSFSFLNEAMSTIAPVARTFGFGIEDTTALLGTLANAGFDASSAATATRNILLNLADTNGKLAKQLGEPVKTLPDLVKGLQTLRDRGVNLNETLELTDKRSVAAFNTFLSGAESLSKLRVELDNVDGELERIQRERLDTVQGSTKLLSSAWEGLTLAFSKSTGVMKSVLDGLTSLVNGVTKLVSSNEVLSGQLDTNIRDFITLEEKVTPLVARYEELRFKTSYTKEEHEELDSVIKEIAQNVPGVISKFDEYGNALDINTDKVWEYVRSQRAMLEIQNADEIKKASRELGKLKEAQEAQERELLAGGRTYGSATGNRWQPFSEEEMAEGFAEMKERGEKILGYETLLSNLTGEAFEDRVKRNREAMEAERELTKQRQAMQDQFNKYNQKELKKWITDAANANSEYLSLAKEIFEARKNGSGAGIGNDNTKYSLDNDASHLQLKKTLRQQYADGEIASEKEYQDRLLAIEISSLQARLATNKESGADREKLAIQLADKLIEQKKREQKDLDAAEDLRIQNITDATERENAEYERRKRQYAGNAAALDELAKGHARRLNAINLKKAQDALKQLDDEYKQSRRIIAERHKFELQDATLSKAQKARLKQEQINELKAFDEEYLRRLVEQLKSLESAGTMTFTDLKGVIQSIDLDTELLSEEEKNELLRRIKEVETALDAAGEQLESVGYSFSNRQGSLFGFSQDDWGMFFDNLANGKVGIDEISMAFGAAAEAANMALELVSGYDKMMTARENADLKRYQKNNDKKKKQLQSRLDAGLMTEAQHKQAVEQMDAEHDKKEEELRIKQAERQKKIAIAQASINMAAGIVKTLAEWGLPWGLIPAALMATMGGIQIAMIANTPVTGAEEGGFPVERAQDGKKFNARIDPKARGYINKPTVLVSEDGMEYVIPNEAMQNPTAAPIIDMFETVRKRGRLRDFDFSQVMPGMILARGYAAGGPTVSMPATAENPLAAAMSPAPGDAALVLVLEQLLARLKGPITAEVSLMGRGGLLEAMASYDRMIAAGKKGGSL